MAATNYPRNFLTTCNSALIEAINADIAIVPNLLQIINDPINAPGNSDFWFDAPMSPAEIITFDNVLAAWVCPGAAIDPTTISEIIIPNIGDNLVWNGTEWVAQSPPAPGSSIVNISHQLSFGENGTAKNEWLELYGDNKFSNSTFGVMPFKSKLIGITFSNKKKNADTNIRIYSTPEGGGTTPKTLDFSWTLVNKRTAHKTDFVTDIIFDIGDKIAVYAADTGSDPQNVVVTLYFVVIDATTTEGGENFSGNYAAGTGGGSS